MSDPILYTCVRCKAQVWVEFDWQDRPLLALGWAFTHGNAHCRPCMERWRRRNPARRKR